MVERLNWQTVQIKWASSSFLFPCRNHFLFLIFLWHERFPVFWDQDPRTVLSPAQSVIKALLFYRSLQTPCISPCTQDPSNSGTEHSAPGPILPSCLCSPSLCLKTFKIPAELSPDSLVGHQETLLRGSVSPCQQDNPRGAPVPSRVAKWKQLLELARNLYT